MVAMKKCKINEPQLIRLPKMFIACFFLGFLLLNTLYAQSLPAYYVYFVDKGPQPSKPINHHNSFYDQALYPPYIVTLRETGVYIRHSLKWLNAVSIEANETQLAHIRQLPYVASIVPLSYTSQRQYYPSTADYPFRFSGSPPTPATHHIPLHSTSQITDSKLDTLYNLYRNLMHSEVMEKLALSGKGVRIAVFDAGFEETLTHPALAHLVEGNQIIAAKDFYDGDDDPYHHSLHGTQVLSCLAGMYKDQPIGFAQGAEFLLARTEHERKEFTYEEDHWIAALEWATENESNIVSNSITFTDFRYSYEDMDGQTAPVSKAAQIASEKGVLIISAMGNEGDSKWKYMGAPSDVPAVLSVGGSMPMMPMHIPFASVGPNYVKERKPNISAPAYLVGAQKKGKYDILAGTSFSTPIIAGMAACLQESRPKATGQELKKMIEQLGHFYPYYDYYLGSGIPDLSKLTAASSESDSTLPHFQVGFKGDSVIIAFDTTYMRTDSLLFPNGRVLYFHKEHPDGYLTGSYFAQIPNHNRYYFFRRKEEPGILRIWFEGHLFEYEVK